jgi:mRNA-degrading endonuclease toxin of MazEF toxin-antitoxin module
MSNFSRGDIVLAEVEYTNHSGRKVRPVVVISMTQYNQSRPDLIVLPISSNLGALAHPGDHMLADWRGAGLLYPSIVKATPQTIDASLALKRIGVLPSSDLTAVEQGLRRILDLL